MKWGLPGALLVAAVAPVLAGETVSVCYNYGCLSQSEVQYADRQLAQVQALLAAAHSAAEERQQLSLAIGWLLGWAGEQTPIAADRGGNTADDGVYGRMDCIDHATTATRLLRLLEVQGWLRFHRVRETVWRVRYLVAVHHAAQIEEIVPPDEGGTAGEALLAASGSIGERGPARYIVDSWFRDNGQPALVIALQDWLDGGDEEAALAAGSGSSGEAVIER